MFWSVDALAVAVGCELVSWAWPGRAVTMAVAWRVADAAKLPLRVGLVQG
jgi:hypothetical protein